MKNRAHILIVEDDLTTAAALSSQLAFMGFEPSIAMDGISAAVRIKESRPDLIIMDFQLPAADGASVHQTLELSAGTAGIPMIFCSNFPPEQVLKAVPLSPKISYIRKPVKLAELKALIDKLLGPIGPETA